MIAASEVLAVKVLFAERTPRKDVAQGLGLDVRTGTWARRLEAGGGPVPGRAVVPQVPEARRERVAERGGGGWTAARIYRESLGIAEFRAPYASVRRLVKLLRAATPDVCGRMTFAPGEEAQVDFANVGSLDVGEGRCVVVHLLVVAPAFSRMLHAELVHTRVSSVASQHPRRAALRVRVPVRWR